MRYPKYMQERLKKQEVKDIIRAIGEEINGTDLKEFVKEAYEIANQSGYKYTKIYLEKEYYGYDGGYDLFLMGKRLETNEEYSFRKEKVLKAYKDELKNRKTVSDKKKQAEIKELKRLKRKYE